MNNPAQRRAIALVLSVRRTVALAAAFTVTRVLFAAAGGRFASEGLSWYWQFLDIDLLQSDLGRSLLYLHMQPPLFNLLLGLLLKSVGIGGLPLVARALFGVFGFSLVVFFDYLLRRTGYQPTVAAASAVALVCLPEFFIYENYLFYPYLIAGFLAWSVVFLDRYLQKGSLADGFLFFSSIAATVLTWAFYAPALLLVALAAVAAHGRSSNRQAQRVFASAAVPVGLVLFVCVKNLVLFDFFGTGSQGALVLSQSTVFALPINVRQDEIRRGVLSPLAAAEGPFRTVDEEQAVLGSETPAGVAVLDERTKAGGAPNFNNAVYLRASRMLSHDAAWAIAHQPQWYFRSCRKAVSLFFQPAYQYSHVPTITHNLSVLGPVIPFFDWLHGRWSRMDATAPGWFSKSLLRTGWLMAGLYVAIHVAVLWILITGGYEADNALGGCVGYAWLLSVYTFTVGIAVQAGENNRFRFSTEPIVIFLLFYVCARVRRRWI